MHFKKDLIIAIFAVHFVLIIGYNFFPKNVLVKTYTKYLFDQNWAFFAPDPPLESKTLYFRYKSAKTANWSSWKCPALESHQAFDYNRFSYHGKLLHFYASLNFYMRTELANFYLKNANKKSPSDIDTLLFTHLKTSKNALALRQFFTNWCRWKKLPQPTDIQCLLMIDDNLNSNRSAYNFRLP